MFESPAKARNNDEQKVNSNVLKHETAGNRKAKLYFVMLKSNRMRLSLCSGKNSTYAGLSVPAFWFVFYDDKPCKIYPMNSS